MYVPEIIDKEIVNCFMKCKARRTTVYHSVIYSYSHTCMYVIANPKLRQ